MREGKSALSQFVQTNTCIVRFSRENRSTVCIATFLLCSIQNTCINSTRVSYTVTRLFKKYQIQDE